MGGGSVFSKLTTPNSGVIDANGENVPGLAPVAGSVAYAGLPSSTAAPTGVDLFNSTIAWDNPNCTSTLTPTLYNWYCPAGSGGQRRAMPAAQATSVGRRWMEHAARPSFIYRRPLQRRRILTTTSGFPNPPGSPPAMTGPGGEVCTSPISYTGSTRAGTPSCGGPVHSGSPSLRSGLSTGRRRGLLFRSAGRVRPAVCTPTTEYLWHCQYTQVTSTPNPTCPTTVAQVCGSSPGTTSCTGTAPSRPLPMRATQRLLDTGAIRDLRRSTRATRPNQDLSNYRMIMVDRKFGWNGVTQVPSGTNPSNAVGKY